MKYIVGPKDKKIELIITLPEGTDKKILCALSGGADSAILLYILAKLNLWLNTKHTFIPFTIPRPDGGANYSPKIVQWINSSLGTAIPPPLIHGDGNLPHEIVVKTAIQSLLNTDEYDIMYLAENKIPDEVIQGLPPIRSPVSSHKRVILPFWALTKDYTIDLYFKEDVLDLLKLTHSCTEQTVGRCGNCFQCSERKWAFTSLMQEDPGSA